MGAQKRQQDGALQIASGKKQGRSPGACWVGTDLGFSPQHTRHLALSRLGAMSLVHGQARASISWDQTLFSLTPNHAHTHTRL